MVSLPADTCCVINALQYTDNKSLQSGLQWNKYNNSDIEIFKPCYPQPCSPSCNPLKF